MEERLESSLRQRANKLQQILYELCSDYHTFCCDDLNEGIEHLKNFIGYTLFGLQLPAYEHNQIQIIYKLYNKIIENSNDASTIYCGLIFNVTYFTPNGDNAYNCIYPIPIFKVGNFKTCNQNIKDGTDLLDITYIDIGGRVYNSWEEYLAKNTLKNMTMILPYKGIYSLNPALCSGRFTSSVHTEKILSRTTNGSSNIMRTNCDADMTIVSGGVNILFGGCWQKSSVKDHMAKNLPMYIEIDNIIIHGLLDTFDPPTMNANYIKCGQLDGTDVFKLSKHITYIGNCIVPEEILRNFLVDPNDDSILSEYEAQLREIRHTTEHRRKHKDAPNAVKRSSDKNRLIIRKLKTIKIREEMFIDPIIYSITEPAGELTDDSVKPYVGKVLEYLKEVCEHVDLIPWGQMKQLVGSITLIKSLGVGWELFVFMLKLVLDIVREAHLDELSFSIEVVFIQTLDIVVNYITLCAPHVASTASGATMPINVISVIRALLYYLRSKIPIFAQFLAQKISSYCNSCRERHKQMTLHGMN